MCVCGHHHIRRRRWWSWWWLCSFVAQGKVDDNERKKKKRGEKWKEKRAENQKWRRVSDTAEPLLKRCNHFDYHHLLHYHHHLAYVSEYPRTIRLLRNHHHRFYQSSSHCFGDLQAKIPSPSSPLLLHTYLLFSLIVTSLVVIFISGNNSSRSSFWKCISFSSLLFWAGCDCCTVLNWEGEGEDLLVVVDAETACVQQKFSADFRVVVFSEVVVRWSVVVDRRGALETEAASAAAASLRGLRARACLLTSLEAGHRASIKHSHLASLGASGASPLPMFTHCLCLSLSSVDTLTKFNSISQLAS